ncbi:MAG: hypothetical protein ACPKM0_10480 [Pleomorphochaeta sp.]
MELVDKYIYSIGRKLPLNSKKEIEKELKSLILDEIETKYGKNPSKEEQLEYINEFGSPSEVAQKYRKNDSLIAPHYSQAFITLIKILTFALSIAFIVVFIINVVSNMDNPVIIKNVLKLFSNIFTSSLCAIGGLTIFFIFLSRYFNETDINFDIPWDAKELESIEIDKKRESKVSIAFELILSIIFLSLINYAPRFIEFAQRVLDKSPIQLGHYINIEIFETILIYIIIVWVIEIISMVIKLVIENNKIIDTVELIVNLLNIGLLIYIIQLNDLYVNYQSLIGFRGLFVFVLIVSIIEVISNLFSFVKNSIVERYK